MFKFTVLLLLCAAATSTRSSDVFRGCATTSDDPDLPGKCFQLPEYQFRNKKAYMGLAEEVLKLHSNHTTGRYVDTIFRISRVVNQRAGALTGGILVRLEFLNIRSKCATPCRYSISGCKPVWNKFVFGLLIGSGDVRLGTTGAAATALDRQARNDHASTIPTPILDYQLHRPTGTCAYVPAVERHPASAPPAIYLLHEGPSVTGHGGTVDMRFSNCPFAYILQQS
ncbi:hypothetical protein HPB52_001320 [Rhipicephalus sanguineus]|uniref:Uncharacterized protein n=1 Tax=Rhipicephalus sanguineus TaxID=34632 RepID=A0A9D4ST40_RHISA|nr:hypothetical protein HPB52_001320 [Rhipicephalus sanguineus]